MHTILSLEHCSLGKWEIKNQIFGLNCAFLAKYSREIHTDCKIDFSIISNRLVSIAIPIAYKKKTSLSDQLKRLQFDMIKRLFVLACIFCLRNNVGTFYLQCLLDVDQLPSNGHQCQPQSFRLLALYNDRCILLEKTIKIKSTEYHAKLQMLKT